MHGSERQPSSAGSRYEERLVEVPQAQVAEVIRQVPKHTVQQVQKGVPKASTQVVEKDFAVKFMNTDPGVLPESSGIYLEVVLGLRIA